MDDVRSNRRLFLTTLMSLAAVVAALMIASSAMAQAKKTVEIKVVDKAGYDKVIAANKGKVVVVDCWATWCVPCRKAFPQTVELSKTYVNQGVVVISFCFDDLMKGKVPPAVTKFLNENNATFENLISALDISADGADVFKIPDGALPHFKIYGKDGKLFKTFESGDDKEFKHEEVEAAVKAAIKAN